MAKHFIINPEKNLISKEEIAAIEQDKIAVSQGIWHGRERKAKDAFIEQKCSLKYVKGKVIIKIDLQLKNQTTFADGTKIRLEREFNNFNRRETQPVNAIVISAEHIPEGSEILISHNALHDSNRIFSHESRSVDIEYYSIAEKDCFAWWDDKGELQPMKNYAFAYRVFKPYEGRIGFITPVLLENILYITTGEYKGKVVHTEKAADYVIVYQGKDGKEAQQIRCKHFEDEQPKENGIEEIMAVSEYLTGKVNAGELVIGITPENAKKLNEYL